MAGRYHVASRKDRTYREVVYDSKAEAAQAAELDVLLEYNQIDWWLRQVTVPLGDDHSTRIDFLVGERDAVYGIEVKGVETPQWKRTKRLWAKYGPFPLRVVKGRISEEIQGRERAFR